jgi:hypothetical protein
MEETDLSQASVAFYKEAQLRNNTSAITFASAEQAAAFTPPANENLVSVREQIESFESVSGRDLNLLNLLPISSRFRRFLRMWNVDPREPMPL